MIGFCRRNLGGPPLQRLMSKPPNGKFADWLRRHIPTVAALVAILALASLDSMVGLRLRDIDKALLLLLPVLLFAARQSYWATLVWMTVLALVLNFFVFRPIYAFGFQNGLDLVRFTLFLAVATLLGFWASWTRREMARRDVHSESADRKLRDFRGAHGLAREIASAAPRSNIVPLVLSRIRGEIGAVAVLLRTTGRDIEVVPAFSDTGDSGRSDFDAPAVFPADQLAAYFPSGQWLLLPLSTHVPHTLALRVGDAFGRINMDLINLLTDLLSLAIDRQQQP